MLQTSLDKELEYIDYTITEYSLKIAQLKNRRCELLAEKQDLDLSDVFECITEKGLSANEIMQFVNKM